jgi:hypothetical protein
MIRSIPRAALAPVVCIPALAWSQAFPNNATRDERMADVRELMSAMRAPQP